MTSPSPIWYFGPDWDLRPLVCPEPNIEMPIERYGGVFQALSGARTMDVTGHKQRFTLELQYLDPSEFAWLESLHRRAIPGPFRLLNPTRKNLLSAKGSLLKVAPGYNTAGQGAAAGGGMLMQVRDWPPTAPTLGDLAVKWTSASGSYVRLDPRHMFPVTPGEDVTVSAYMKGVNPADDAFLILDWYDKTRTAIASVNSGVQVIGDNWGRVTFTGTPPAGAYTARMAFYTGESTPVYMAAAQAEYGSSATTWELGGGAPRVLMDALDLRSPRFPYVNTTLSLLEA